MGSSLDNHCRYISLSSEGLSGDPLQRRIPHLLGYPPMDCISQDGSIIVVLGRIVKLRDGICELNQTRVPFLSSPYPKGSTNKDLSEVSDVRTRLLAGG